MNLAPDGVAAIRFWGPTEARFQKTHADFRSRKVDRPVLSFVMPYCLLKRTDSPLLLKTTTTLVYYHVTLEWNLSR